MKRSRSRPPTSRAALALAAAALLAAPAGCGHGGGDKAELPAPPQAAAPSVRTVKPSDRLEAGAARVTGVVRSKSEATLSSKITAQIARLDVNVGDRVRAGQVLVQLDATNARIQLQNAQAAERLAAANLANARLELGRTTALSESGAVAPAQLDRAKTTGELSEAQLDQARAAVRAAQQQIADATLAAPFAGVVSAKHKNAGDTVASMPPTAIVSVVDPDRLEVRLTLPEALAPFAQPGETLRGAVSPSGAPFEAKVRALGAVIDPATRTIEVLADVPAGGDAAIKPGALVTVDFAQADSIKGPFLPAAAVRREGDKSFVMVVGADGRVERREVTAVPVNPGTVLVRGPVGPADRVALDPSGALRPGDRVSALAD
ncbi:MAG TPA: efflux RND transporter periplasmic adaptor subunit [Polyangiaceae bacterium]|nr:efflux RND transporter periplasmic adaptor subunit [Polyangiaceae bacterium]